MSFDEIYEAVTRLVSANADKLSSIPDTVADLNISGKHSGVLSVAVKGGKAKVVRGASASSEARISVSAEDFTELINGRLNPMAAILSGRVSVSGNYAKLMGIMRAIRK